MQTVKLKQVFTNMNGEDICEICRLKKEYVIRNVLAARYHIPPFDITILKCKDFTPCPKRKAL
ncbi:hypothetical protein B6U79_01570 [Candidatus Bathyarchaeota archaeon ex4484_231]|nr:MAG: hypothetical protein B6U79_01570 [Candidatus Bathyarchaeota archaeon ex4484_231]